MLSQLDPAAVALKNLGSLPRVQLRPKQQRRICAPDIRRDSRPTDASRTDPNQIITGNTARTLQRWQVMDILPIRDHLCWRITNLIKPHMLQRSLMRSNPLAPANIRVALAAWAWSEMPNLLAIQSLHTASGARRRTNLSTALKSDIRPLPSRRSAASL